MDGWSVVRYGRRGQRGRRGGWDQGYGDRGDWMDSAPSFSTRRRDTVPYPNRPAPPPGGPQYPSQFRSYADVVRQYYPQPARRWVSPGNGGSEVRRQPADPQLGKLVRKIHALIKMVHHLQNVSPEAGKSEPRMISRMVDVLADMIKPAAPTTRTVDLITGNAKHWGYTTCLILRDHYEAGIEELCEELSELLTQDWRAAFEVSVRWARRNLPRITQDVMDQVEALITARIESRNPAPQQKVKVPQQTGTKRVTIQTQTTPQPTGNMSVGTMTDKVVRKSDWTQVSVQDEPPREQRDDRRARKLTSPSMSVEEELDSPGFSSTRRELDALFDGTDSEEGDIEAAVQPSQSPDEENSENLQTVVAQVHQEDDSEGDIFEESFDRFTSPEPERFRVQRHPNTQRKLTDWNLVVKKKWLMIGDSNLSRLPDFFNKNLQIDSFPGSHFRHGQALMEKTVPPQDLVVEKVVLSFGLNSRGNKSKETTVKNMQAALRSTKRRFPYAEIWIPLVNFSSALPSEERENLQTLNDHIERNMPFIPLLPDEKFQTEADDIHWTGETGEAIFEHWMRFLNS